MRALWMLLAVVSLFCGAAGCANMSARQKYEEVTKVECGVCWDRVQRDLATYGKRDISQSHTQKRVHCCQHCGMMDVSMSSSAVWMRCPKCAPAGCKVCQVSGPGK